MNPAYIHNLTLTEKKSIRALNWADTQLYNHFKRKFELLVKRFGRKRMDREVNELRDKSRKWYQMCENITNVSTNDLLKDEFKKIQTKESLCCILKAPEMNLTDLVRRRQDEKYPDTSKFFYNKHRRLLIKATIFSFIILLELFIILHHFLKTCFQ